MAVAVKEGEKIPEEKEKTPAEKDIQELRKEIELRSREIQELKKKVEELKAQISEEKTPETSEMNKMLEDVSEILDIGFSLFDTSSKKRDEKTRSRGLTGLIGELAKLTEKSQSYRKEIDLGGKRGVIDFSVRTGPLNSSGGSLAKPIRRGISRKTVIRPLVKPIEKREPLVDILDEEDGVKVVAELPGIEKDDLSLELAEDLLTIKVDTPTRKYYKEVKLPTAVEKEIIESTYRNGILEVKLKKRL